MILTSCQGLNLMSKASSSGKFLHKALRSSKESCKWFQLKSRVLRFDRAWYRQFIGTDSWCYNSSCISYLQTTKVGQLVKTQIQQLQARLEEQHHVMYKWGPLQDFQGFGLTILLLAQDGLTHYTQQAQERYSITQRCYIFWLHTQLMII